MTWEFDAMGAIQSRYVSERADFAVETTLSGRRWTRWLDSLTDAQYRVIVNYL